MEEDNVSTESETGKEEDTFAERLGAADKAPMLAFAGEDVGDPSLCDTPAVDDLYLETLRNRVALFKTTRRFSNHEDEIKRERAIKLAAIARQKRQEAIKTGHGTILDMVSGFFELEYKEVLECVLDDDEHIELLSSILEAGGKTAIIFNYQLLPPPALESGRNLPDNCLPFKRIIVTDGSTDQLQGKCLAICKLHKNATIEYNNLYEELQFVPFDPSKEGALLTALEELLDFLCCDHLRVTTRWGELMKVVNGPQTRKTFLGQLEAFERFLQSTKEDIEKKPEFYIPEDVMEKVAKTDPSIIHTHKTNPQLLMEVENMIQFQYKKIDQILREGEKIQQARDDIGPRAVLEYWRSRLTQLTSILDFVHSEPLKLCLTIVQKSLTFHVKDWPNLSEKVRNAVNESVDNVKYLYDFDRISQNLYSNPPPTMGKPLRDLLYNVRMIYLTSRYYNTTERVTAILVKITNQIVLSCKAYLTDEGDRSIWSLTHLELIRRIQDCTDLYESYKASFAEIETIMKNNPKEKPFGCSEANVFVKLTTFIQRLAIIRHAVQINLDHSILHSSCLEGISKLTAKFDSCMKELATKSYDPLDEQKPDYERDYEEYLKKFKEAEQDLRTFSSNLIADCPSVLSALRMIQRFEELNLPSLCLELEYLKQIEKYYVELENIMDRFNDERTNVRLPKGMPAVAGRIAWVRMLLAKIKAPMDVFQNLERVSKLPQAQLAIRRYNRLCKVFVNFEMLHHEEWAKVMCRVDDLLHIPILTMAGKSSLMVNWHDYIKEQILEVKFMRSMDLDVPDSGFVLYSVRYEIQRRRLRLRGIVEKYNKLRKSTPEIYLYLVSPLLYKLDVIVDAGVIELTWMSVGIDRFCDTLTEKIHNLEIFFQNISDIKNSRIDDQVAEIAKTLFLKLDDTEPVSMEEYRSIQALHRHDIVGALNTRIKCVERATIDIVNSFVDGFDAPNCQEIKYKWLDPKLIVVDEEKKSSLVPVSEEYAFQRWDRLKESDLSNFHRHCMKVYNRCFKLLINALLTAIHETLSRFLSKLIEETVPLITTELHLEIPSIKLHPSLQEVQTAAMELAIKFIKQMSQLFEWGRYGAVLVVSDDGDKKGGTRAHSYSKIVSEDREVVRLMRTLQGAIIGYTSNVDRLSNLFLNFSYLWELDRVQHFSRFLEQDPTFIAIEDEMLRLAAILKDIQSLPDTHDVYGLRIHTATGA